MKHGRIFGVLAVGALVVVSAIVIWSTNGERLQQESDRAPASVAESFIQGAKTSLTSEEVAKRSGIAGVRSRAVVIATGMLRRPRGQEIKIRLDLFSDVAPVVSFKVPSGLDVNDGMHSGYIESDPESRVVLTTSDGKVSGFVHFDGRKYRIVADPEMSLHYVVEEK